MSNVEYFEYRTESQIFYEDVLENHFEAALSIAEALIRKAKLDENGCLVTNTSGPRKVRFLGYQDRSYRYLYYVLNFKTPHAGRVVRHRCSNRRCINPKHLVEGTHAENLQDEYDLQANGVDFPLLLRA